MSSSNSADSIISLPFSPEKKCELIELVKATPCLWNTSIEPYRFPNLKEREWIKIAEKLDISSVTVKKQWDSLRSQYCRIKKGKNQASGSAAINQTVWGYYNMMEFLSGVVKPRPTSGNISSPDPVESGHNSDAVENGIDNSARNSEEDQAIDDLMNGDDNQEGQGSHHGSSYPGREGGRVASGLKRRFGSTLNDSVSQALLKELSKESDEDQLFADFIAASLRKLNPRAKIRARLEIQQILGNAEINQLTDSVRPQSASIPSVRSSQEIQPTSNASFGRNNSPSQAFQSSGSLQDSAAEDSPTYATLQPMVPSQIQYNGSPNQFPYSSSSDPIINNAVSGQPLYGAHQGCSAYGNIGSSDYATV